MVRQDGGKGRSLDLTYQCLHGEGGAHLGAMFEGKGAQEVGGETREIAESRLERGVRRGGTATEHGCSVMSNHSIVHLGGRKTS